MNKPLETPKRSSTFAPTDALPKSGRHLHRMETVVHAPHKAVELLYFKERSLVNGYGPLFEGPDALAETIQKLPGRHYKGKSPGSLRMFLRQSLPLEGHALRPVSDKLANSIHVAVKSKLGATEYEDLRAALSAAIAMDRAGRKRQRKPKSAPIAEDPWSRFTAGERIRIYSNSIVKLMDSGVVMQLVRRNLVRHQGHQLPKVSFIFPTDTECMDFWGILDNMFLIQARELYSISSHISMARVKDWLGELEREERIRTFCSPEVEGIETPCLVSDAVNKEVSILLLDAQQDHRPPTAQELAALSMSEIQYAQALSLQANN